MGRSGWPGLSGRLGCKAAGLSLTTKRREKKTEIKKEKKEGLGEEVGHADSFPELTKMSLIQEK